MEVQKDFKEFLALLNAHEVDFMIVGGYALAYHGAPRYTGDIDVFIKSDSKNAQRIIKVLEEFGFSSLELSSADFQKKDRVVQLGLPPVRIDIITSISGVSWEQADASKEPGMYGDVPVFYIGKNQYVANKKATGRPKDIADIEALGEED
ncbi:MAG: nucleotidyltransferase family protein [Bacteroidetes bacterium]|nr:nucleotidyltransferase family protein [Bacteroidota bacterium]